MSDFWKTVRTRRVRDALIAKAKTGRYGDPGTCACCGEQASQIETGSRACLLCFIVDCADVDYETWYDGEQAGGGTTCACAFESALKLQTARLRLTRAPED